MININNPLQDKYEEFLDLLHCLCENYDHSEKDILSLSISTAIRVLVHDTKFSISLLSHLGKKNVLFLSTNHVHQNQPIHLGLVRRINVGVNDGKGGEAKYWPLCDERYFSAPKESQFIEFNAWWNEEKVFESVESSLTRRDLILSVANKDGGAHFETKVQKKYDDFRHSWSGGSTLVGNNSGHLRGYDNMPIYPAVRQIGHELLSTLKP